MPIIYFTVTNDLNFDQRMIRICSSLVNNGFQVVLVGRNRPSSLPPGEKLFVQKRLPCFFDKGILFYAEYNIRLFFFLLFRKMDGLCAIDLDTILPVYLVSLIRSKKRIYDAHELFCEMKEIVERPKIYRIWKWIEKITVPFFRYGYTVNHLIAEEFKKMYRVDYHVIRSLPLYKPELADKEKENYILYQGAVNEGRSFESLLPAMQWVKMKLIICGDGNFMSQARQLVVDYELSEKVIFKGNLRPELLESYTAKAYLGVTLFEKDALSNYYSLANRFFDYIHAGVPQICVDYPAYREINRQYEVAVLTDDLSSEHIAGVINRLIENRQEWEKLHLNCRTASMEMNWQKEEKKLIEFYRNIFG